jgi:hypothetical protein
MLVAAPTLAFERGTWNREPAVGPSGLLQRKNTPAALDGPTSTDAASPVQEQLFGYDLSRVPVQLQRMPAAVVQRQTQTSAPTSRTQTPSSPASASALDQDCDQAAMAMIEQARTDAIHFIDAAIPIVMHGLHDTPTTWNGMIARELLDRHFHCPTRENMEYILTTLRDIRALLPTEIIGCLAGEQGRTGEHFALDDTYLTGRLYRGFFRDASEVCAGTLITMVGQLAGLPMSYNRHDPGYNEFTRIGAGLMTNNPYSYGYFSAAAAGHEVVSEPPGGVTCRPPEPEERTLSATATTLSSPPMACYSQGRETGRDIVVPPAPARPYVLTSTTAWDGDIGTERVDNRGRRFVCVHGRRVEQSW